MMTSDLTGRTALDLRDARSVKDLAHRALETANGQIDVLVNNAGWGTRGPTPGFDEATFDGVFGTTLKAPLHLVGEIAPAMAERGKGSIIGAVLNVDGGRTAV